MISTMFRGQLRFRLYWIGCGKHYGDRRIVEELYDVSRAYVDWLHAEAVQQLNSSTVSFYQFGDWCSNQSKGNHRGLYWSTGSCVQLYPRG